MYHSLSYDYLAVHWSSLIMIEVHHEIVKIVGIVRRSIMQPRQYYVKSKTDIFEKRAERLKNKFGSFFLIWKACIYACSPASEDELIITRAVKYVYFYVLYVCIIYRFRPGVTNR